LPISVMRASLAAKGSGAPAPDDRFPGALQPASQIPAICNSMPSRRAFEEFTTVDVAVGLPVPHCQHQSDCRKSAHYFLTRQHVVFICPRFLAVHASNEKPSMPQPSGGLSSLITARSVTDSAASSPVLPIVQRLNNDSVGNHVAPHPHLRSSVQVERTDRPYKAGCA
jgi:hypothetical protein